MNMMIESTLRTAVLAAALLAAQAFAAPGAHGPNGEHLDGPVQQARTAASPRAETKSELFELVATLAGGELSVLVDRYETNEPVLDAKVEVESGALKAVAKFQADYGVYSVDDAAMLQALARPGEHPLVFTIAAGPQTDLLDATLEVGAAQAAHDEHAHLFTPRRATAAGVVLLLAAVGVFAMRRRSRARGVSQ
jgi:hypothetical protein